MRTIYLLLVLGIFTAFNFSCKKDNTTNVSIIGKWYATKQSSKILNNGTLLSSSTKTTFTTDDFAQFYSDGSGYFSQTATPSAALVKFNYTLSGDTLKIYSSSVSGGVPTTITSLTLSNLSIHSEALVLDQNNPAQTDNEIDDFYYSKTQ